MNTNTRELAKTNRNDIFALTKFLLCNTKHTNVLIHDVQPSTASQQIATFFTLTLNQSIAPNAEQSKYICLQTITITDSTPSFNVETFLYV